MDSMRAHLEEGKSYNLHTHGVCFSQYLCVKRAPEDAYDRHNAILRSVFSGWEFLAHGVNMYEDGTIDWDFSTGGYFNKEVPVYHV